MNEASTAGVKYVSIFLHPPCFHGFFFFILEFTGRFCFCCQQQQSVPPRFGTNNPTASIKRLNKSSEIGTVSGRGIGRRNLSAALIRDMECEQRRSLRANKICTPAAAGILIPPLCRFNYCGVAALLCSSRALRGGDSDAAQQSRGNRK